MGTERFSEKLPLTEEQRRMLEDRLDDKNSEFRRTPDFVSVKELKPKHPNICNTPAAIGRIRPGYLELINLDSSFPENYHQKLRALYDSICQES